MEYAAESQDLRALLSVAAKLRGLAAEPVASADRELYLTAAAALEARANWMATTLPEERGRTVSFGRKPVDMLV